MVGKLGAREIVRIDPPRFAAEGGDFKGPAWGDLFMTWSSEGVHALVQARYSETEPQPTTARVPLDVGSGSCVFPGGARPDPAALQSVLDEMCTTAGGKRFALRVRLDGVERVGDVLWLLAADQRPASCRLPAVVEAGAGAEAPACDGARSLTAVLGSFPATARARTTEEITKSLAENAKVLGAIDEDDEPSEDAKDEDAAMSNEDVYEAFGVKTGK